MRDFVIFGAGLVCGCVVAAVSAVLIYRSQEPPVSETTEAIAAATLLASAIAEPESEPLPVHKTNGYVVWAVIDAPLLMSKSEYERIAQRFDTDYGAHVHFFSHTDALVWWNKKPAMGPTPRKYWLAHVQIGGNGEGMYFDDTDPDLKPPWWRF